jgi:hypothetical protein
MRRLTVTIALLAAVVAGAVTSAAAILHFTGDAKAEPPATLARPHARVVARVRPHTVRSTARPATPSAAKFARLVAGASDQYGEEHSAPERIRQVHCVQASAGHYMCSYTVVGAGGLRECHLIQATWTPDAKSTFTVTLSGRTARCRTLRDALDSLG